MPYISLLNVITERNRVSACCKLEEIESRVFLGKRCRFVLTASAGGGCTLYEARGVAEVSFGRHRRMVRHLATKKTRSSFNNGENLFFLLSRRYNMYVVMLIKMTERRTRSTEAQFQQIFIKSISPVNNPVRIL